MANDTAPFDGLFPASPSIDSLILGTGDNDVLSAQADGNIVLGLDGDDRLNSTFNLTALIGGNGEDTLTTKVIVPLQGDAPVNGLAIQFGGTGTDNLDATATIHSEGFLPRSTGQADGAA
jgi:serralysin